MVPLHGIRVLDASRVLAGPYCGQLLGELGAEVIKLERPQIGDDTRGWGPPFVGSFSAYFLACNRNKSSLTLDIAQPEGAAILHQLLAKCDVLIENFRSDSAEKLGLTPEILLKQHPHLIICSISGYGRTGPMKDALGYDFAIQALSGLMAITGPREGPPFKIGVALTDVITGLNAAIGILACLHARKESGHGYAIDLSLLDCAIAAQVNVAQAYLATGIMPPRQGNAHLQIVPYELFATSDGYIVLNVGNDAQWLHFCKATARDDLANELKYRRNSDRVRHRQELVPIIADILALRTTAEWRTIFTEHQVPHSVVQGYDEVFTNEQVLSRGMKITVRNPEGEEVDLISSPFHLTGATIAPPTHPPGLGEHNRTILREWLNLPDSEIDRLTDQGIL